MHLDLSKPGPAGLPSPGWLIWPGYLLFFLMLFVPSAYKVHKAVLLVAVLGMIAAAAIRRGKLALHRTTLRWFVVMVVVGLVFMLIGAVNGAPWRAANVYVAWPLIYTFLVASASDERVIDGLFRTLAFAVLAIGLYILSFILHAAGWLPDMLYIELDQDQAIGFYDGFMEYWLYSMSSLFFLLPFLFAALLTWPRDASMPVARYWLWAAFILSIVLVYLSGRRSLWLVTALAPFVVVALRCFLSEKHKATSRQAMRLAVAAAVLIVVGAFVSLQIIYGLEASAIEEWFTAGLDRLNDESAGVRYDQFSALIHEWSARPFFGYGIGITAMGSVRSDEVPWAYELSYVALLFHTGIVGFAIYALAVAWIYWMGIKIMRSGERLGLYMLPVLVGTTCFLVANGTNPYLAKFDYLWVIFLPVALINYWLLTRKKNRAPLWRGFSHEIPRLYGGANSMK